MNGSWHRYRPGRALAPPAVAGAARARGSGRRRGVLRRPGRRALRGAGRSAPPGPGQPRSGPPGARLRRCGGRPPAPLPGTPRPLDQRRAARPAGARRHRQHLAQRDAVRRAGRPARAGRRPRRRHAPPARRDGPAPADGECRDRPGAQPPRCACTGARDGRVRGAGRRSGRTSSAARTRGRRTGARRVRLGRDDRHRGHDCGPVRTAGPPGSSSPTRTDRRAATRSPSRGRSSNGWRPARDDPVDLVRRSFVFLLEREPKESILRSFDLPVIGRYFPDYEREITS